MSFARNITSPDLLQTQDTWGWSFFEGDVLARFYREIKMTPEIRSGDPHVETTSGCNTDTLKPGHKPRPGSETARLSEQHTLFPFSGPREEL